MSRYRSYINSAVEIIKNYQGAEPFAAFIKKFFSLQKKYGATDRKQVSHLCYCYFRLGTALAGLTIEEKMTAALFLCSVEPNELLNTLQPGWNEKTSLSIADKMRLAGPGLSLDTIFPWANELSAGIDRNKFILSHLQQPALFLRLRPGKKAIVLQKLQSAGIGYQVIADGCLAFPNSSKLDDLIAFDKEAVVQDYSSQRVGELIQFTSGTKPLPVAVWDCCAGSGGKSILAKDILGDITLAVSDIRESILSNLKKRFKEAGIDKFDSFLADLANPQLPIPHSGFQLIIADVPCTGSGTWSRTPERLSYFNKEEIDNYSILQQKIVSTITAKLRPGGYLLYITCSVFQKENEAVVAFAKEKFHLQELKMEFFKGYDKKADTMFAALLQRPLQS